MYTQVYPCLITPIMPEVLSARELVTGTQESLLRLQHGEVRGLAIQQLRAVIYAQDQTKDARMMASEIRSFFQQNIDGSRQLLDTVVPEAKAYKKAELCVSILMNHISILRSLFVHQVFNNLYM